MGINSNAVNARAMIFGVSIVHRFQRVNLGARLDDFQLLMVANGFLLLRKGGLSVCVESNKPSSAKGFVNYCSFGGLLFSLLFLALISRRLTSGRLWMPGAIASSK